MRLGACLGITCFPPFHPLAGIHTSSALISPPCRYERLPEPPATDDPLWGDFDAESSDRLYMIGINGRGQVEGEGVEPGGGGHF